jgi:hypothetical protein
MTTSSIQPAERYVLNRLALDIAKIQTINRLDPAPLAYDDIHVLALQRLWIDVAFAFKEQLAVDRQPGGRSLVRRVIRLRNTLAHTAIDDIVVDRLLHDSRSIVSQLTQVVAVLTE